MKLSALVHTVAVWSMTNLRDGGCWLDIVSMCFSSGSLNTVEVRTLASGSVGICQVTIRAKTLSQVRFD